MDDDDPGFSRHHENQTTSELEPTWLNGILPTSGAAPQRVLNNNSCVKSIDFINANSKIKIHQNGNHDLGYRKVELNNQACRD